MNRFPIAALAVLSLFVVHPAFAAIPAGGQGQDPGQAQSPQPAPARPDLNWKSKIVYRAGRIVFILKDGAGQPVRNASVTASLARRSGACLCRTVVFSERKPGVYVAPTALASGTWDVHVSAGRQAETYEAESTFNVD